MTLIVNGIEYSIHFEPQDSENLKDEDKTYLGVCCYADQKIVVCNEYSEERVFQTIVHEICHAYMRETQANPIDEDTQEIVCDFMSYFGEKIFRASEKAFQHYKSQNK